MGRVFLAKDIKTGKKVAVKIVKDQNQWEREREILKKLSHVKGVPKLFFAGKEEQYFLVMQYIRGKSIKKYKRLCGKLSRKRMILWMYKVSKILQKIHKAGIVHMDLKPENMIIHPSGEIYIIDFGVSLMAGEPITGYGTKIYASKRQRKEGEKADFCMDLYSLGKVIELNLKQKHSQEIKAIIYRCLNEDDKERYKSVEEIKKDLRKIIYKERTKKVVIFFLCINVLSFLNISKQKSGEKVKSVNEKIYQNSLKKGMIYFYGNDQTPKDPSLAREYFIKEKKYEKKAKAYLLLLDALSEKKVLKNDLTEAFLICQEDVNDFWSAYFFEHYYWLWIEKLQGDFLKRSKKMLDFMERFSTDLEKQKIVENETINLYEMMAKKGNPKYFLEETNRIFQKKFKDEKAWDLYERKIIYLQEQGKELEGEFEKFIQYYPKVTEAYIEYGIYLCQKGKMKQARTIYRKGQINSKMEGSRAQGLRRKLGL